MGTVHEVSYAERSAFFGDALNYIARVLGASYKGYDVSEDDIIATADGPSVGSGRIEGIAHLIRDFGYCKADAGDDIEVSIRYPAENQSVKIRRYSKDVWSSMPMRKMNLERHYRWP